MACCCGKKSAKPSICQSCAMPMRMASDFGTNADGSKSSEYCVHCYQKGVFVDPTMTVERMAEDCTEYMKKQHIADDQIAHVTKAISSLKRWKK